MRMDRAFALNAVVMPPLTVALLVAVLVSAPLACLSGCATPNRGSSPDSPSEQLARSASDTDETLGAADQDADPTQGLSGDPSGETADPDAVARQLQGMQDLIADGGLDAFAGSRTATSTTAEDTRSGISIADPPVATNVAAISAASGDASAEASGEAAPPEPTIDEMQARLAARFADRAADKDDAFGDLAMVTLLAGTADRRSVSMLSPSEQDALEAVREIGLGISAGDAGRTAEYVRAAADDLDAYDGLTIDVAALCSSVGGFGQYEAFEGNRFLAGARKPAVLYIELDGFASEPLSLDSGAAGFEIAVSRELTLYHDADGLLAWRQPAFDSKYRSRTVLRDFYLTERIELPATLSVGKYRLKVSVRDLHGGGVVESTIPIQVVADSKLATARNR
ncbi:MAG: hypothetical protein AAF235_09455 [Planctomycetota bacterium]